MALKQYQADKGSLPITSSYGEANPGGWDYSSQGDFVPFLVNSGYLTRKLVPPKNDGTGDVFFTYTGSNNSGYAYAYYCYSAAVGWPPDYDGKINLAANLENPGPNTANGSQSTTGAVIGGIFWEAYFEDGYSC